MEAPPQPTPETQSTQACGTEMFCSLPLGKKKHILNVCLYEAHRTTVGLCGGFGVVEASSFT